ncbi:MAG: 3-oxoacyl-ACP reductase FabG [Rubrobacteraceae bacterium]|nr:3-oxoacyl-ACP reductase FabG [Rubrobacteraceae bacterium]
MIFDGKVAWVTGSSKGIGRATALSLAEQGCDVAVHYGSSEDEAREVAKQVEAHGRDVLLVGGDVSRAEDVRRMAGEIEEHYGRVDILVNNAGSMVERLTLAEMTEEVWDRVMDVNLKSVYLCSQAVLPMMKRQGGGKIINMTSVSARNGGSPSSVAYATAKGGVSTLTRAMAKELVSDGILVNAVSPGRIDTPFHDEFTPDEKREEGAQQIPLGREGTPEEVVGAVLFLASSQANYILGEVIEVNGGMLMD